MRIHFKNDLYKKKEYMLLQIIFCTYAQSSKALLNMDSTDNTPTLLTNSSSISQAVSPSNQSNKVKADQLAIVVSGCVQHDRWLSSVRSVCF